MNQDERSMAEFNTPIIINKVIHIGVFFSSRQVSTYFHLAYAGNWPKLIFSKHTKRARERTLRDSKRSRLYKSKREAKSGREKKTQQETKCSMRKCVEKRIKTYVSPKSHVAKDTVIRTRLRGEKKGVNHP